VLLFKTLQQINVIQRFKRNRKFLALSIHLANVLLKQSSSQVFRLSFSFNANIKQKVARKGCCWQWKSIRTIEKESRIQQHG